MMEASVQTSSDDLRASVVESTPQELLNVVRSLKLSIEKFDRQFQSLSPDLKDGITNSVPHVAKGFQILQVVREALEQVLAFLESPLGRTSADLVAKNMDKLRVMVEVGAGVMISGLFVVVVGQLQELNKGDFDSVIRTIEDSQKFVRERLPEIERLVIEASGYLKQLRVAVDRADNVRVKSLFWHFEDTLRLAKLDIDDCEIKLRDTNAKIDGALDTINGSVCLAVGLSVVPPVYSTLKKTFNEYKAVHDDLHAELNRLKRHLDNHQRKYESDFKPTRSVGSGDSC